MTATQRFIEDAIKCGWRPKTRREIYYSGQCNSEGSFWSFATEPQKDSSFEESVEVTLLDPLAWQAVGKTRGWHREGNEVHGMNQEYKWRWHAFIDHLADGKTIEEALASLE